MPELGDNGVSHTEIPELPENGVSYNARHCPKRIRLNFLLLKIIAYIS
jgi:hypothetical protein